MLFLHIILTINYLNYETSLVTRTQKDMDIFTARVPRAMGTDYFFKV